jgi:hypothetical protein
MLAGCNRPRITVGRTSSATFPPRYSASKAPHRRACSRVRRPMAESARHRPRPLESDHDSAGRRMPALAARRRRPFLPVRESIDQYTDASFASSRSGWRRTACCVGRGVRSRNPPGTAVRSPRPPHQGAPARHGEEHAKSPVILTAPRTLERRLSQKPPSLNDACRCRVALFRRGSVLGCGEPRS